MKSKKAQSRIGLINFELNFTEDSRYRETSVNQLNQNANCQLINPEALRKKRSALLRGTNNPTKEWDFRRIYSFFNENPISDPELNNAYQEYVKAYHQVTSLYCFRIIGNSYLVVFDTENKREERKALEIPVPLDCGSAIALLPSGELFCYGTNCSISGITLIVDSDCKVRFLPSGTPNSNASAVYFNRSVYCFGGDKKSSILTLSSRFDLDQNRWIKLAAMPKVDDFLGIKNSNPARIESSCSSIVFDRKILISGYLNEHLLLYSIDADSFSMISHKFGTWKVKILINIEDRLYLIESGWDGRIYESGVASYENWTRIEDPLSPNKRIAYLGGMNSPLLCSMPPKVYCSYNKGNIYIGCTNFGGNIEYLTFNLKAKVLRKY